MLIAIIVAISLLLIWGDYILYQRFIRRHAPYIRWSAVALFTIANTLPYIAVIALQFLDLSSIAPLMWLLTVYVILSLSRIALYAGVLTIKNRYAKWIVGVTLCTIVAYILLVGVVHTRKDITVRSTEIASVNLPKSFDGYRIVFFSDLHIGSLTSVTEMCNNLVERINSLNADLVIFGGDLINARYDELTSELRDILGGIKSKDGVIAVLGNHDTGVYVKDTIALPIEENTRLIKERIEAMKWHILDDESEWLVRDKDSITITGIGFSRKLLEYRHSTSVADSLDIRPIYRELPNDKFNLSISHMPQLWRKISELGYGDLVLSGHVHAMQMKCRIGDCEISPAQLMYREWSGHYREGDSHLYISDGIGSVGFHLRVGAPPEITELTLRRAD